MAGISSGTPDAGPKCRARAGSELDALVPRVMHRAHVARSDASSRTILWFVPGDPCLRHMKVAWLRGAAPRPRSCSRPCPAGLHRRVGSASRGVRPRRSRPAHQRTAARTAAAADAGQFPLISARSGEHFHDDRLSYSDRAACCNQGRQALIGGAARGPVVLDPDGGVSENHLAPRG